MNERMTGRCPDRRMLEAFQRADLTAAERHRVERHARSCPLCAAALAGRTEHPTAALATQADLRAVRRQLRPHLPRRDWRLSAGRIAAAVVGLLLLGWVVWYYAVAQRPYRLYLAAFDRQPVQAYQALRSLHPQADTLDPRIVRGLQALRAEDDLAALAAFRAYLADHPAPADGRPLLYTGLLALSTGHLAEAQDRLEQLRRNYPALKEDATWYLALTNLRERVPRQAIPLLEELTAPTAPGEYRREADELLRQLQNY